MNSGMFHVPDSHPTPSAFLLVLGFSFGSFFGRSGRSLSPSRRCSLGSFALVALHA